MSSKRAKVPFRESRKKREGKEKAGAARPRPSYHMNRKKSMNLVEGKKKRHGLRNRILKEQDRLQIHESRSDEGARIGFHELSCTEVKPYEKRGGGGTSFRE